MATNDCREGCTLFGKPIAVKHFACRHDEEPACPIPPSVNLFVKVTDGCNARCAFCSNAAAVPTNTFDTDKLFRVIDEILGSDITLNRVNITGGEPSVVAERVADILERISSRRYAGVHVHLNTNGLLPTSQTLMRHKRWDSISVSLHHYAAPRLSELYGVPLSPSALTFEGVDMMKVNASCNLIRGYIDSTTEAHKMMDFCLDRGFTRLGFVGLMPVNDYCKEHFVALDELHLDTIPHCYFTESKNRGAYCRCSNYLYNKHLRVLDIYMRHYADPQYCASSLLFDGAYLRQGFLQQNIIY